MALKFYFVNYYDYIIIAFSLSYASYFSLQYYFILAVAIPSAIKHFANLSFGT